MAIRDIVKLLRDRRQDELEVIHKKYRRLIREAYAKCTHDYGDWFIRTGTVIEDTNWEGRYFEHRICAICGREDTRLPDE